METTEAEEFVDVKIVCEGSVRYTQIVKIKQVEFERLVKNIGGTGEILAQAEIEIALMIDRSGNYENRNFHISEFVINEEK